ncbi:MAG: GCN5-related N-acetyltransferase [Bryobacterales bacterium]|jgi:GNAT superfamily N-acetyltransferase|nr:GCN5-related N-acetyltransferase [Bryobacterales bacterium]
MTAVIKHATQNDGQAVALMVKSLTDEIIERTGAKHFNVNVAQMSALISDYLARGHYWILLPVVAEKIVGFSALCPSYALYTEGPFGIIQEFYIDPAYRSARIGGQLLLESVKFAKSRGWRRLELCTPPLPEFSRTVAFYESNGFEVTGGRKMKCAFG